MSFVLPQVSNASAYPCAKEKCFGYGRTTRRRPVSRAYLVFFHFTCAGHWYSSTTPGLLRLSPSLLVFLHLPLSSDIQHELNSRLHPRWCRQTLHQTTKMGYPSRSVAAVTFSTWTASNDGSRRAPYVLFATRWAIQCRELFVGTIVCTMLGKACASWCPTFCSYHVIR